MLAPPYPRLASPPYGVLSVGVVYDGCCDVVVDPEVCCAAGLCAAVDGPAVEPGVEAAACAWGHPLRSHGFGGAGLCIVRTRSSRPPRGPAQRREREVSTGAGCRAVYPRCPPPSRPGWRLGCRCGGGRSGAWLSSTAVAAVDMHGRKSADGWRSVSHYLLLTITRLLEFRPQAQHPQPCRREIQDLEELPPHSLL